MNLTDELTKGQLNKFQINEINDCFDFKSIIKTLSNDNEGILNLDSKIDTSLAEILTDNLKRNNKNYEFELNYSVTNYEIMFKKKGANN